MILTNTERRTVPLCWLWVLCHTVRRISRQCSDLWQHRRFAVSGTHNDVTEADVSLATATQRCRLINSIQRLH